MFRGIISSIISLVSISIREPLPPRHSAGTLDGVAAINGSYKAVKKVVNPLYVNGNVEIGDGVNEVVIEGTTLINGRLIATNAIFKDFVTVNGSIKANDSTFEKGCTVNGESVFLRCNIKDILEAMSSSITLDNCQTKQIYNTTINPRYAEKIYIKGQSVIGGDIRLESGKGQVYLSANSSIKGQVHGGQTNKSKF